MDEGNFVENGTETQTARATKRKPSPMQLALEILEQEPEPLASIGRHIYKRTACEFGYVNYTDFFYRKAALLLQKDPEREGLMNLLRGFTAIPEATEYISTPYFYLYDPVNSGASSRLVNRHWEPFALPQDVVAFYDGEYNVRTHEFKPWGRAVFGPMVMLRFSDLATVQPSPAYLDFKQTIESVIPDPGALNHFHKIMGTILQPHVGQKQGIWFEGPSGSRKSTIATALLTAPAGVGGFSTTPIDKLADDRHSATSLIGKWANFSDDAAQGRKWVSFYKQYTGSSIMQGEYKYVDVKNYPATAKLLMCVNKMPHMADSSDAIWGRTEIFKFERSGELDRMFTERSADNNKLGVAYWSDYATRLNIVNWLLSGLEKLCTEGRKPPEAVLAWNNAGVQAADPVRLLLADTYTAGDGVTLSEDIRALLDSEHVQASAQTIAEYMRTMFNAEKVALQVKDQNGKYTTKRGFKGVVIK